VNVPVPPAQPLPDPSFLWPDIGALAVFAVCVVVLTLLIRRDSRLAAQDEEETG
jgi:hypothetical protein